MATKFASMTELLRYTLSKRASDVHIGENMAPMMRVDSELVQIEDATVYTKDEIMKFIMEFLSEERFKVFEQERELDYSFGIKDLGRFRANLYFHKGSIGAAVRALPFVPMNFEKIGFPAAVAENLACKPSGMVLVCGATGSGKTTTLAAMIDYINQTDPVHIVTMEDPIEFVFQDKRAVISQREVGSDTHSFNQSLKHVLRQDPDVILVGELRDLETIEMAMTAAETGHLVFATLHTPDAVQSINRIIDVFPAHQQQQVRVQLSFVIQAVICQQLIPRVGGGLSLAPEIMIATPAIRTLIRDSKSHQIYSSIQMGQKEGMRTMNMSLAELVKANRITREDAYNRSNDIPELERLINNR